MRRPQRARRHLNHGSPARRLASLCNRNRLPRRCHKLIPALTHPLPPQLAWRYQAYDDLADSSQQSLRSCQRAIKDLQRIGAIFVLKGGGRLPGGRGRANGYRPCTSRQRPGIQELEPQLAEPTLDEKRRRFANFREQLRRQEARAGP